MYAISELTREKTVIMIAHRLKTVRHADQIIVVDKGQVIQRGTHEELLRQDGIYRRFITGREQAAHTVRPGRQRDGSRFITGREQAAGWKL